MKFNLGDVVRIRKDSKYYGVSILIEYNPVDVDGVVIKYDSNNENWHVYRVRWDNGYENVYRPIDLEYSTLISIEDFI